jgi:membrane-bound serine protease (ClpP class)
MNKLFNNRFLIILAILLMVCLSNNSLSGQDTTRTKTLIYKFGIQEMIAPPVWRTTKLAIEEAEKKNADLILIHLNTYGGMLESADSIRTKILNTKIPVWVFIDHNAASAGALISIASDSIYMVPGATIGAATVVDQQGEVVADKYQSYMRAMMRSTAEATGRDPNIAQAMVDPRIKIENVIDSGSVLTFTANEALQNGFCEAIVDSEKELLELNGITDYEIVEQELTGMDRFIGFLISPIVSGILIMIIIGGIYFELQSPGVGFPLVAAIVAALLYFAPLYMEGLADNWEILLFIGGIILIAIEIFALPGFGVSGILGVVLVITGLTLSLIGNVGLDFSGVNFVAIITSLFLVITSIFLSLIISFFVTKSIFSDNRLFGSLALEAVQSTDEGFTSSNKVYESMLGQQGFAHSVLRPSGKVIINDDIYDATSLAGYIEKGEAIEVVRYETSQLFVRKITK